MSGVSLGVVVVARDAATTIGATLRSVAAELDGLTAEVRADVVVVDGASTDATADVAAARPGVRVVAQRGLGLAAARNQGIGEVEGELIAFLDADDRWPTGSLAARFASLAHRSGAVGVVGHLVGEAAPQGTLSARQLERVGRAVPAFTPGALLARRTAFELVGMFDETLGVGSDSEWFVRARTLGHEVYVLPDVVLCKSLRSTSLSNDVVAYRRELLLVARRYLAGRGPRP